MTEAKTGRGPQKAPKKMLVSLRLDPDVVEHFKAGGDGWQSRMNAALRRCLVGAAPEEGRMAAAGHVDTAPRALVAGPRDALTGEPIRPRGAMPKKGKG